jgi:protein TonB
MQVGDRYLEALEHKPRVRRAGTLVLAVLLHGAAITTLALWGFYHLDEMPAPQPMIFQPPSGPKPGGGPKIDLWKKQPPKKIAKSNALVQPIKVQRLDETPRVDTPEPQTNDTGTGGNGGEGGNGGAGGAGGTGTGDCVVNCSDKPGPVGPPRLIDPEVGKARLIGGEMPRYSERARAAGVEGTIAAKICVTSQGGISSVTLLRGLPFLDETVLNAVRGWRYKPFTVGERAMPFCYVANFEFHLQGR